MDNDDEALDPASDIEPPTAPHYPTRHCRPPDYYDPDL